MAFGRELAEVQEENELLRDQLVDVERERDEYKALAAEYRAQLDEVPRPVAKTVSGTLYRHVDGHWVPAAEGEQ